MDLAGLYLVLIGGAGRLAGRLKHCLSLSEHELLCEYMIEPLQDVGTECCLSVMTPCS